MIFKMTRGRGSVVFRIGRRLWGLSRGVVGASLADETVECILPIAVPSDQNSRKASMPTATELDTYAQDKFEPVDDWTCATPAPLKLIERVVFGQDGNDASYIGSGWLAPFARTRWTVGTSSEIQFDYPGEMDVMVQFRVQCAVPIPGLNEQRLDVYANGHHARTLTIIGNMTVGVYVPHRLFAGGALKLTLKFPDAGRPVDFGHSTGRHEVALAFSEVSLYRVAPSVPAMILGVGGICRDDIKLRSGLPSEELLARFESLGDNCEFGLVQRHAGAEPLGLLRFTFIGLPKLHMGLQNGFEGLGELEHLDCILGRGETPQYVVQDKTYGMNFYTYQSPGQVEPEPLRQQMAKRIQFLVRKFREDLAEGRKICVIRRNPALGPISESEIWPLLAALHQIGPSTLLWMTLATDTCPPGTVERICPGLLRGFVDRFSPNANAHDLESAPWFEVCVNAHALVKVV